jgi:8-oxo-dGTP pyrophosphatase MutT (NUDIX family)
MSILPASHQNAWLALYEDEVITPSGKPGTYTYTVSPPFVLVLAYDGTRLVLVRQYRYPLSQIMTEFPGGGIDAGETPLQAAQRELKEEAGVAAARWTELGTLLNPNEATIFLAEELHTVDAQAANEDGITECVRLSLAELHALISKGQLPDSKTLAALLIFEQFLERRKPGLL